MVRELDAVRVKGKQEPVVIYELYGYGRVEAQTERLLAAFRHGLAAYKQRQWSEAMIAFQEALSIDADDEPARLHLERCQTYQITPPPDDWDGVFVMNTK